MNRKDAALRSLRDIGGSMANPACHSGAALAGEECFSTE